MLTDFYQTERYESEDGTVRATIRLHSQHDIFKGHFPNNPVTPGVCMLHIFKELSEKYLQKKLQITECSNVKFMALINPETHPVLQLNLTLSETETGVFKVKATAAFEDTTAIKLNIVLTQK